MIHAATTATTATTIDQATAADVPTWLQASVCEGVARAHAVGGRAAARDAWIDRARQRLAAVADADERALIESQLATIDA